MMKRTSNDATCTIWQVPVPDVPPKIDKQLATPPKEPNASRRRARSTAPQAAQAEDGDGWLVRE